MAPSGPPIICIGASAGGVEALEMMFKAMPRRIGAATVIVTHLSRQHKSMLPDILGRWTTLPVLAAEDGMVLEADKVYTLMSNTILTVADHRLQVQPRFNERNPIDIFLASLADQMGSDAVAVILSGTGSDGAIGTKAVREGGGFTVAQGQDHTAPGYQDMPASAIATGFVDCIAPVQEIPSLIVKYLESVGHPKLRPSDRFTLDSIKREISQILLTRTGHDFGRYKERTFLRRVERRMAVHQIDKAEKYIDLLSDNADEAMALFRDLLINVTSFFRDAAAFDALNEQAIDSIFERHAASEPIRVWVPGCATGEEAYSIAMLLLERRGNNIGPKLQIFATDLHEYALSVARLGRYPKRLLEDVPSERLQRFFADEGANYVVTREVRECCMFSMHSLIRDPPFSNIDLISCRNLLIYLTGELQEQIIPVFHYALRPDGFLFLGISENVSQHPNLFSPLDKKHRLFRRINGVQAPSIFPLFAKSVLNAQRSALVGGKGVSVTSSVARSGGRAAEELTLLQQLELRVMDRYAPAHVLVNAEGDVLHFSTRTGRYFEPPPGAPTRSLIGMARRGLRAPLRALLRDATRLGKAVSFNGAIVQTDSGPQIVDLAAEPAGELQGQAVVLVVISHVADLAGERQTDLASHDGEAVLLHAEQELQQTREMLQAAVEEHDTSVEEFKSANEELLSVNEELQSTNEELETSKEELQSLNEEMHTVNADLASKIDELDHVNTDLKNLFDSTQIATVFLDGELRIRGFTPAFTEIFKLIASDRGRPLTDIAGEIDITALVEDIHKVMQSGTPIERKVEHRERDRSYLLRVLPYRTSKDKVDGVILTFIDVSQMVEAESHQQLLVGELNHRVKNILAVVTVLAKQIGKRSGSIAEFQASFVSRVQGLSRTHQILAAANWSDVSLRSLIEAQLAIFAGRSDRIVLEGSEVLLHPQAANAFSMVVYELATNAAKYGALSNKSGRLLLHWEIRTIDGAPSLVLEWQESGGPKVTKPERRGYGTEMIERVIGYELEGKVALNYGDTGFTARLMIPTRDHIV